MGNTSINYTQMSDGAIVAHIGRFIKHTRTTQNKTQEQLAKAAGLNRWTMSQIENGESINLSSLIQILRALDCLYILDGFDYSEEISPLEYAKLKKRQIKERVRNKTSDKSDKNDQNDLGW
ncbi:transcriptional regulator, XRE family [Sinomicrobium oceani]|uniref:Transcriptional regulator, XRE family n=2 Tax=Sinomicrobium oceani TaxID=1150368 RepID=A0A1K1QPK1_9FLAO|nr:transcriptional regulator, XRE family [Sinomicrobium oceani]